MRLADLLHQTLMKGTMSGTAERLRLMKALGNTKISEESIRIFEDGSATAISTPKIKFGETPTPVEPIERKPSVSVQNFDRITVAVRGYMILEKHERQAFHDMLDTLDLD